MRIPSSWYFYTPRGEEINAAASILGAISLTPHERVFLCSTASATPQNLYLACDAAAAASADIKGE